MDFRRRKLLLALGIVGGGTLMALLWHAWQGWVMEKSYPYNTFLFLPYVRFWDFTEVFKIAAIPGVHNNYFPAAYLLFYPLLALPPYTAAVLFLGICIVGLYALLLWVLQPVLPHPLSRALGSAVLLWSYPVLYCLDRGNTEILLVLLIALSLTCYHRRRFTLSFFLLLAPICFKLYPAALLLLFFRRRLIHWIPAGIIAFLLLNGALLLSYPGSLADNLALLQQQFAAYNQDYVLSQRGVGASASAWNFFRVVVWIGSWATNPDSMRPLTPEEVLAAFHAYYALFLIVAAGICLHVVLVETKAARRAMLILLYMTVSAPGGGDYKLMLAGIALVILILLKEKRSFDLPIVALLGLCLIPKREVVLVFLGSSDSGYADASLNVLVNPPCVLVAMALLVWSGWQESRPWSFRQHLCKLWRIFQPPLVLNLLRQPTP